MKKIQKNISNLDFIEYEIPKEPSDHCNKLSRKKIFKEVRIQALIKI